MLVPKAARVSFSLVASAQLRSAQQELLLVAMGQVCTPGENCCGDLGNLGDAISRMYRAARGRELQGPRPRVSPHWRKLRAMVWSTRAFEKLLEEVRSKHLEELYDQDWSEAPTPEWSRSPSMQWQVVQKVSRSLSVLDGLLNEVRCKQTEQLYDSDWNTACSEDEICDSL